MTTASLPADGASGLRHNREFVRLWTAQAISKAGTAITETALPLTAVLVLDATPAQMAMLVLAGQLPNLLFGLLAGVWVDRARRRPILIGSDVARMVLFGSIPVAAALGMLSLTQLWIIAFISAGCALFSMTASVALLPRIVAPGQLIDANSRLQATDAVMTISGQSVGGVLVQLLGAPRAIVIDATSYLASACTLRNVGRNEPRPTRDRTSRLRAEIGAGLRELFRTPLLRAIAISAAVGAFAGAISATVLMLFLVTEVGLAPATIGIVIACAAVGSGTGAALAGRVSRRFGIGPMIVGGMCMFDGAAVLTPLATETSVQVPMLMAGQFFAGMGFTIYRINQLSLRQAMTPPRLLGRVTSARTFIIFCMAPLGAILGGYLGSSVGLHATLYIAASIGVLQTIGLSISPVPRVRTVTA